MLRNDVLSKCNASQKGTYIAYVPCGCNVRIINPVNGLQRNVDGSDAIDRATSSPHKKNHWDALRHRVAILTSNIYDLWLFLEVTPLCSYSNSCIVTNRLLKCLLCTIFLWTYLDFDFSKVLPCILDRHLAWTCNSDSSTFSYPDQLLCFMRDSQVS